MAKRLTEKQKNEIINRFTDGETIEFLAERFNCTKLTIIRNLKRNLGESRYREIYETNKRINKKIIDNLNKTKQDLSVPKITNDISKETDFLPVSSFIEITPLNYEIENTPRKELSSVSIKEIDFPRIVYLIVDKKIELIVKMLKDYPVWSFLPIEDLNRKTIEIYFDLKIAKRFCSKEQKVIKVPNTNVFKIAAPLLKSKGISRIISDDMLIAL